MIIPSNRNDLSRDEQNQIFGGGMMKKFLHQQFDSPYFLDGTFLFPLEQSRFKKPGYAVEEKI